MFTFYEKLTPFGDTILEEDDHTEDDHTEDEDLPNTNIMDSFFFSFLEEDNSNDINSTDSQSPKPLEITTDLPDIILCTTSSFESIVPETPTKEILRPLVEEIVQSVLEKIENSETEQIMDKETESLKESLKESPKESLKEKQHQNPEQVNNPQCGFCVLQ